MVHLDDVLVMWLGYPSFYRNIMFVSYVRLNEIYENNEVASLQ